MGVGSATSWSDYPILGPYSIAVTGLTTVAQQVLAADSGCKGVIFHNPGSKAKRILPVGQSLVGGTGGIVIYPQTEYKLLQDPNSHFNINCAWQAVTDDNTDGALTVLSFTPNTPNAPQVRTTIRTLIQNLITSPVSAETLTVGTGSQLVLPADPNRMGVQFHNPGTVQIGVCPSNLGAAIGAGSIIVLPGDTKTILGNDYVKVNCGWNAAALTGNSNALTAMSLYG